MSDVGFYTVRPGQDVGTGLPPIELPTLGPQRAQRERIEITPGPQPVPLNEATRALQTGQTVQPGQVQAVPQTQGQLQGDPFAAFRTAPQTERPATATEVADPFVAFRDKPAEPSRQVGTGESLAKGAYNAASFGFSPAIEGAAEASGLPKSLDEYPLLNLIRPIVGAARTVANSISDHPDPEVKAAYDRGREAALSDERAAQEQHPAAFLAGQLAGSLTSPAFGAARAGGLAVRLASGAVGGAVGGGLYGTGTAVSAGEGAPEVAKGAMKGAAIGGTLGAGLAGVLGRRAVNPNSPGQRASRTAEDLGAPLPRGVATDSRFLQATTAKLRSVPFAGERIGERVGATAEAAGNRIGDIAGRMTGGAVNRSTADAVVRPGIETAIQHNRDLINRAYNGVRSQINQTQHYTMPRTDAALNRIMADRQAAGHTNPALGLEQFRNVAGGATFNGAHRARVDAREAGNVLVPHPGYNAADFNRLTRAMTADIREMVQAAATHDPRAAVRAFDTAELEFGRLAEQNGLFHKLAQSRGEGAIATLLGAAKEKGGNVRLLAQLRNSMPRQDFEQIGGVLLHELGHNNATGQFSLAQFTTAWNKVSDNAKNILFSPAHLQHIEDIAQLGSHVKGALRESNTSHTASALILMDVAKDIAILGGSAVSGSLTAGAGVAAASTAGVWLFTRWLATPATAAAMSNWTRAYRAFALGHPTPARIGAFNMATRNLAHNLNVPIDTILKSVQGHLGRATADQPQPDAQSNQQK